MRARRAERKAVADDPARAVTDADRQREQMIERVNLMLSQPVPAAGARRSRRSRRRRRNED